MERSDALLIKQAQSGDLLAFEMLVIRYHKPVLAFLVRFLNDQQDREDIAQDTFIALYKNLGKVDPSRKFTTYIFEIAKNKAFSFLRKQGRKVPLLETLEVNEEAQWYDTLYNESQQHALKQALTKLSKSERHVIHLFYFERYDYQAIAEKLLIPINTVRTHLHRAKAKLKEKLQ